MKQYSVVGNIPGLGQIDPGLCNGLHWQRVLICQKILIKINLFYVLKYSAQCPEPDSQ